MSKKYQYSVLKYRPSYLLDERVNIGLLFYFFEDKTFRFVYPNSLQRVTQFFPHSVKHSEIKPYLRAFEQKAKQLTNSTFDTIEHLNGLITREFLVTDANSFFFTEVEIGYYESIEKTLKYYEDKYFRFYQLEDTSKKRRDDIYAKNRFEEVLNKIARPKDERLDFFRKGITLDNKIGKTEFEYGWQNGTANLIKTLGFGLVHEDSLQKKAFRWFGALTHLAEFARIRKLRFDLLIAPPINKTHLEAYHNSLDVLHNINADKKIVEINGSGLEKYIDEALNTIKPFDKHSIEI